MQVLGHRQDVAHREMAGAQPAGQFQHLGQIVDVALHGDECNPQFRLGHQFPGAGGAHFAETRQVFNDGGQLRPQAHIRIAIRCGPVDGNPENVQSGVDQLPAALLIEQRAVGDHLHPGTQRLGLRHPLHGTPVEQRLADAAEIDRWDGVQRAQAVKNRLEGGVGHASQRLIPGVAETGHTVQVAAVGRLDVDLGQMGYRAVQPQTVGDIIDAHLRARRQTQPRGGFRRQHQPSLVIDSRPLRCLHPGHRCRRQGNCLDSLHS